MISHSPILGCKRDSLYELVKCIDKISLTATIPIGEAKELPFVTGWLEFLRLSKDNEARPGRT